MVIYTKGQGKYFDSELLKLLRDKNNAEVLYFFQKYNLNNDPLEFHKLKDSSRTTLLHYATEYGNTDMVKYFLQQKSEIEAQDVLGRTSLMLAVMTENALIFEILLKAKADINLTNNQGENILEMIFQLQLAKLKMLKTFFQFASWQKIIKGIIPNELYNKLYNLEITPEIALEWGSIGLIQFLTSRGNAINAPDSYTGKSLLHVAIEKRLLKMAKVLIEFGANVDGFDCDRATPLFYLFDKGYPNASTEILEILQIFLGRATFLPINEGRMQIANILKYGSHAAIKMILKADINLYETDYEGNNAMHFLACNRSIDLFKIMRGQKFDMNVRNNDGNTPLLLAVEQELFDTAKFCLEYGADVNAMNNNHATCLHLLLSHWDSSNEDFVEILLQYGADPQKYVKNDKKRYGCTVFDLILSNSQNVPISEIDFDRVHQLSRAEPLLACLAINQVLGTEINKLVREKINMESSWVKYFDNCQRKVEKIKNTTIYGNITLFEFLSDDREKKIAYVRNEEFVAKFKKIINQDLKGDSLYLEILRGRLTRAIELSELKEKAINSICHLYPRKRIPLYIARFVADYLNYRDMDSLCLVWNV